jgi:hypothetical protein
MALVGDRSSYAPAMPTLPSPRRPLLRRIPWSAMALLLASLAGLLPLPARAWGHQGHMLVGAIADQLLTPQAQAGVQRDLGLTLAQAGPWADCAKSVQLGPQGFDYVADERWASPACKRFETREGQRAMQDFVARNWDGCGQRRDCHRAYHFADVATVHGRYLRGYVGAHGHDVVHAVNAAIAQLQGQPVPAPFRIANRGEALRLLAHWVGDLHQPLHVGALYLNAAGQAIDPDAPGAVEALETRGGNSILLEQSNLHALWDDLPDGLRAHTVPAAMLHAARTLRKSRAGLGKLAKIWASDTVKVSAGVFTGLRLQPATLDKGRRVWPADLAHPGDYHARRDALQTAQLTKAGARLAQLVNALYATPR